MPQVIIHKVLTNDRQRNGRLAEAVRKVVLDVLEIDETYGQVIIYEAPMYDRSNHENGKLNFVFVEITMLTGRSKEAKQLLVQRIIEQIEKIEGVSKAEINCVIHEIESENYIKGMRVST
ncbi:tautomerase family protein [Anaerobacillus sp. CMMVII]|uniref:tautomerase family protein n=1 Tax=Anaerobacillus sp. CMMVII TaxID=2755588 RepID=UPI0021B76EC8|nr:tautomerase family protein [Anaerobacillus sp. CMMVII]MCT8139629.1 tautomerase family protein [Anaerobacillus sp. CMMVII]